MNKLKLQEVQKYSKDIIEAYIEGETALGIAKRYNTHDNTIRRILKNNNIKLRGNQITSRKYKINENYFDEIDTPNKAYILGLLYADGNNHIPNNTVSIALQEEDVEILHWINKEIESTRPISFSQKHKDNNNLKNIYVLGITNMHISQILEKKGIVANKSLVLKFPLFLEEHLYSHFIRGYFDGDGHIGVEGGGSRVCIASSKDFCEGLLEFLKEKTPEARFRIRDTKNIKTGVLYTTDNKSVKQFMDYLYIGCEDENIMRLKRKQNAFYKKFYPEKLNQDNKDS